MTATIDRFIGKLDPRDRGPELCWEWQGYVGPHGYGMMGLGGKVTQAHRVAYLLFVGDIPADKVLHHACEVTRCVNPFHLRLVSRREHQRIHSGV